MKTILLIFSICLNFYLFYKYIRERLDRIDYKWMYNRTQNDLDLIQDKVEQLKGINDDLESQVIELIHHNRHE